VSPDGRVYTVDYSITEDTDGYTNVITTLGTGSITIKGLDDGEYELVETKVPSGYSGVGDVVITIMPLTDNNGFTGAANISVSDGAAVKTNTNPTEVDTADTSATGVSDVHVIVKNYKGISLPETGSVASIIVMVVGLMIVLGGAAYLVMSRKKAQSK
jgi:LPXTG-motif cell wall-anchored protein